MQKKESKTNTHFWISMSKSCLRIIACVALYCGDLEVTAVFFLVAEVLGIAEEIF